MPELDWPAPQALAPGGQHQPVARRAAGLHLDEGLLYFDRYWLEGVSGRAGCAGAGRPAGTVRTAGHRGALPRRLREQCQGAEVALSRGLTVLTGGPGTSKTTTVARLLTLLAEQTELDGKPRLRHRVARATGKPPPAAGGHVQLEVDRLAVVDRERLRVAPTTIHQLLGSKPDTSSRFRHNQGEPAAARCDRRRRDIDGVADDDGATAQSGFGRTPGSCWLVIPISSPRWRQGGAGRSGGRAGRRPRLPGRPAGHTHRFR